MHHAPLEAVCSVTPHNTTCGEIGATITTTLFLGGVGCFKNQKTFLKQPNSARPQHMPAAEVALPAPCASKGPNSAHLSYLSSWLYYNKE